MELKEFVETLSDKDKKHIYQCRNFYEVLRYLDKNHIPYDDYMTVGTFFTDAIICPICGSIQVEEIGENTYRCKECGQTFRR